VTEANSRRGKSNRAKGTRWMEACARALREHGWTGAELVGSNGRSDLTGCGDVGVECKDTQDWSHLQAALDQALADALRRGLSTCCVWKKRAGVADPMKGYVIQQADVYWSDRANLERLERLENEHRALVRQLAEASAARGTFTLIDPAAEMRAARDAAGGAR